MHIKSVHDKIKDIFCDTCGMGFSSKKYLDIHEKLIHNTSKIDYKSCDKCGKSFKRKKEYEIHYDSVHLGIKNHTCPD